MLPNVMIITGIIFITIGLLMMVMIVIQPLKKAFEIVFKRNADYLAYEQGEGRELLDSHIRIITTTCIIFLITGIILLSIGMYYKHIQRGELKENVIDNGNISDMPVNVANEGEEGRTLEGLYVSSEGKVYKYDISIHGKMISFNGMKLVGIDELEEKLKKIGSEYTVFLRDDFAISSTYHEVENLLEKYGIRYDTKAGE